MSYIRLIPKPVDAHNKSQIRSGFGAVSIARPLPVMRAPAARPAPAPRSVPIARPPVPIALPMPAPRPTTLSTPTLSADHTLSTPTLAVPTRDVTYVPPSAKTLTAAVPGFNMAVVPGAIAALPSRSFTNTGPVFVAPTTPVDTSQGTPTPPSSYSGGSSGGGGGGGDSGPPPNQAAPMPDSTPIPGAVQAPAPAPSGGGGAAVLGLAALAALFFL